LLSHHGSGYLARAFEKYLRMLAIRQYCAPHHPQTNGKIERFPRNARSTDEPAGLHQPVRTAPHPAKLHRVLQPSLSRGNRQRDPADVYYERRKEILRRRAEQKQRTIEQRLRYNLGRCNLKLTGELNSKL
jgi:hypothetical protein